MITKAQKPEHVKHNLPHAVFAYLTKHMPGASILDIEEIKRGTNKVHYYKVDVVNEDCTYHLRFDAQGRYINENVEVASLEKESDIKLQMPVGDKEVE